MPTDMLLASGLGTPATEAATGEWGDMPTPAERARGMRDGECSTPVCMSGAGGA